jgi:hypothetical protein
MITSCTPRRALGTTACVVAVHALVVDELHGLIRGARRETARGREQVSALPDPSRADALDLIVGIAHRDQPEQPARAEQVGVPRFDQLRDVLGRLSLKRRRCSRSTFASHRNAQTDGVLAAVLHHAQTGSHRRSLGARGFPESHRGTLSPSVA